MSIHKASDLFGGCGGMDIEENRKGHIRAEEMADFITETLLNENLVPGILFENIKNSITQTLAQEFDGVTVGEPKEDARNWQAAMKALIDLLEHYTNMGPEGIFGVKILTPLKSRLDQGERTPDLFNKIVDATR